MSQGSESQSTSGIDTRTQSEWILVGKGLGNTEVLGRNRGGVKTGDWGANFVEVGPGTVFALPVDTEKVVVG